MHVRDAAGGWVPKSRVLVAITGVQGSTGVSHHLN